MLVAAWTVHRHNGFFIVKEGWEAIQPETAAVAAVAIAGTGAGTAAAWTTCCSPVPISRSYCSG